MRPGTLSETVQEFRSVRVAEYSTWTTPQLLNSRTLKLVPTLRTAILRGSQIIPALQAQAELLALAAAVDGVPREHEKDETH